MFTLNFQLFDKEDVKMKKAQTIRTAVLMMGLIISGANVAFSDTSSATGAETKSEADKSDINKDDHGARSDCAPAQDSSSMGKRDAEHQCRSGQPRQITFLS